MGQIADNSLKPKKSEEHIKLGDVYLTANGYMKVINLNPLRLVPTDYGRWGK